jgi:2-polyprenyl-6-methoxyphenol hydroxylase-like FAD-dependent oxidoreductase
MKTIETDIAIVGYGPVGQTLAALLAPHGHQVVVVERFPEAYALPRAIHFDDEIMRVWQQLGIVDDIAGDLLPANSYDWFGADGQPILRLLLPSPGPSGWERGYLFFQPHLEAALDRAVAALDSATVYRGWCAEELAQNHDEAVLTVRQPDGDTAAIRARYVIGADGANSFVRRASGIAFDDLGFAERWLVIDLLPDDIDALAHLPSPCQWCDPARPHMHTRNGRRHRRFEFMLLPDDQPEDFQDEARAWELLAPWTSPAEASIVRQAVYEFRGRVAETMNAGRALLAGDAAHTMPPFMGQGLCSGTRDAAGLAWRLDLILRGEAGDRLLDSYSTERRAQSEWIVNLSTEMGRVSCVLDAVAAAERDAALRAADASPPIELPPLEPGLVARDALMAGTRSVQGIVRWNGRTGRFDDVVGRGFVLLTQRDVALSDDQWAFLERIGAHIVVLDELSDLDGRLTQWLRAHGARAVLIRPDFYVFGAVDALEQAPALVDDLRLQITTTDERIESHV